MYTYIYIYILKKKHTHIYIYHTKRIFIYIYICIHIKWYVAAVRCVPGLHVFHPEWQTVPSGDFRDWASTLVVSWHESWDVIFLNPSAKTIPQKSVLWVGFQPSPSLVYHGIGFPIAHMMWNSLKRLGTAGSFPGRVPGPLSRQAACHGVGSIAPPSRRRPWEFSVRHLRKRKRRSGGLFQWSLVALVAVICLKVTGWTEKYLDGPMDRWVEMDFRKVEPPGKAAVLRVTLWLWIDVMWKLGPAK